MCLPTDYYLTTFYYLSTFIYLSTYYQSTNYYLSNDIFLPSSYLLSPNKLENDLQGNGVIELKSNILVSDGQWHDVKAQFNPAYMEVSVDGEKKSMRPRSGENKHIDLSGLLYIGGIEPGAKKQRAVDQGMYLPMLVDL